MRAVISVLRHVVGLIKHCAIECGATTALRRAGCGMLLEHCVSYGLLLNYCARVQNAFKTLQL